MIVYVVTTGEGRSIKAVFEDRDQAICCCALCDQEDCMLEEWDTEAIQITGHKKPLAEWMVFINSEGKVIDTEVRYTFNEVLKFNADFDGSGTMHLTMDVNASEDEAKQLALNHWQRMKK